MLRQGEVDETGPSRTTRCHEPTPSSMMKHLLKAFGILLALAAGAYFFVYAHHALAGKDLSALLDGKIMMAGAALTLLYTFSIVTTALAWTRLLRSLRQPAHFSRLLPILATTQFGKYLPGNVAHHLGRIALARSVGVTLPAAVFSVAYELLLALVASAHIGALTLLWSPPAAIVKWRITEYRVPLLGAVTLFALGSLWLAPRLAVWLGRLRSGQSSDPEAAPVRLHLDPGSVLACYTLYASSFVLIGTGLWFVAHTLTAGPNAIPSVLFFVGAFASSWILGFVAPGAPAGLGIREAILSAWLSGVMAPADVVLLVIMLRIATTLGDLLNFAWGSAFVFRRTAGPVGE